jgi:predicted small lipoprotein YifL
MKKVLAITLTALMVTLLLAACGKKGDEANSSSKVTPTQAPVATQAAEPTVAPTPTEAAAPTEAAVTLPAGTAFNALQQFDTTSATGENGPWLYSFTTDAGVTFDPCTILETVDKLQPWHPWAGNWTGVGVNGDVADRVELNTDSLDGINGALGFRAPADGKYSIVGSVTNPWDQTPDLLHCRLNGTDLFTVQPGAADADPVVFPETVVELKAGDEVYFFCPSTTADSWVSAYVDVTITVQ